MITTLPQAQDQHATGTTRHQVSPRGSARDRTKNSSRRDGVQDWSAMALVAEFNGKRINVDVDVASSSRAVCDGSQTSSK